jgi:hypothetical protein
MGLVPPKGVFKRSLIVHAGRPQSEEGLAVWVARMRGDSFGVVAKKVFPREFRNNHIKATDRTKKLYQRFEETYLPTLLCQMLPSADEVLSRLTERGQNPI